MKWFNLLLCVCACSVLALPKPPKGAHYALLVQDPQGKVIHDYRSDILLQPASVQKLLTAAAAWIYLGPQWAFKTQFWFEPERLKEKVLEGDLLIEFQGAPDLRRKDLANLFLRAGIREVRGNIYLYQDTFKGYAHASGWSWDNFPVCYATPSSAFVVDHNCVQGALYAREPNKNARVHVPQYQPIDVTQSVHVVADTRTQPTCDLLVNTTDNNDYHLFGCVEAKSTPFPLNFAVQDSKQWTVQLLKQVMELHRVQHQGAIEFATQIPKAFKPNNVHFSEPLHQLMTKLLQRSDNLVAENLLKTLGRLYFHQDAGDFSLGAKAVTEILTKAGIDLSGADIRDGSGLSTHNLLSAEHIMQGLALLYNAPEFDLPKYLAVGFESGSLRYRKSMRKAPLRGQVYAKSGSLEHVSNLAGFVQTAHGPRLFVFMVSGIHKKPDTENARALEAFEKEILESLYTMPNPTQYQLTQEKSK